MSVTESSPVRIGLMKFVVGDLDRMTQFYCDVLGLTLLRVVETDTMIENILMGANDGFALIIYFNKDQREITVGNGHGPLGCYVENIELIVEKAINAGAALHTRPFDVGRLRVAFVLDPEGREIEFIHDRGRRK